jgi:cysteine desulfuration protein SufE
VTAAGPGRLTAPLADLVADFAALTERDRLQLLLELSRGLPDLPERLFDRRDAMEPVPECQSPVFLLVEVEPDGLTRVYFDVPVEAPTTRGFAAVLSEGLDGQPADAVLAVPDDLPFELGLTAAVSPLRLGGMAGMLRRIKRQTAEKLAPGPAPAEPSGLDGG